MSLPITPSQIAFPSFAYSWCRTIVIGESFDIVCFGGVTAYHATRNEGEVDATVLSSIHVRSNLPPHSCVDSYVIAM